MGLNGEPRIVAVIAMLAATTRCRFHFVLHRASRDGNQPFLLGVTWKTELGLPNSTCL